MKLKLKRKFEGYSLVNVKTKKFLDCDGTEIKEYSYYEDIVDVREILNDLKWYIKNYNNRRSRRLKKNFKNFEIVKIYTSIEVVK